MTEICLVEVSVWFVQKNDQYWLERMENFMWETDPPDVVPLTQPTDSQTAFGVQYKNQ